MDLQICKFTDLQEENNENYTCESLKSNKISEKWRTQPSFSQCYLHV